MAATPRVPVAERVAALLELGRCAGGRSRGAGGAVAHLGERFNGIEEAGGSSPPSSTTELHLRVWSPGRPWNLRVLRTHLMHLRRKLGEDGSNPMYIFAEPRVG